MAKPSQGRLPPNPFQTYRDPQTGEWRVTLASQTAETREAFSQDEEKPEEEEGSLT